MLGSLALTIPEPGAIVEGLLISKDYQTTIVASQDLGEFTHERYFI